MGPEPIRLEEPVLVDLAKCDPAAFGELYERYCERTLLAGPCGASGTTGTCLSAHPDFYQQDASAFFFSTAPERLSLPLALLPGLVSGLALSMGTARRRTALFGVILASLPVVAFGALLGLNELRFLGGGFD